MDHTKLLIVLLLLPLFASADARLVESPGECHFPVDNANVDNEYKPQGCNGNLRSRAGGNVYDGVIYLERQNLPGNFYVVDGQDVRDTAAYPDGVLTITTTGAESGTECSLIDAGGTTYTTGSWTAVTKVYRTQRAYPVNVSYDLQCWSAVAQ